MTVSSPHEADEVEAVLHELASESRIDSPDRWRGVPDGELSALEQRLGRRLPSGYRRFLELVGLGGASNLEDGSAMLWPDPLDFAELVGEMVDAPLDAHCTPILVHQGYYVQWLDSRSGEVLAWTESEPPTAPVPVATSFAGWLRRYLDD